MPTTVFILGAGASKQAGAPLMAEFLSVARRLWQTGKVREYDEAFKTVFDAMAELQAVHSKSTLDFNNVESLFSAVELAKTIGKFPNRTVQQIDGILDALKIVIVATLEKTILFPSLDRGSFSAPRPYSEFVSLVRELRETARPTPPDRDSNFQLRRLHRRGPLFRRSRCSLWLGRNEWGRRGNPSAEITWFAQLDRHPKDARNRTVAYPRLSFAALDRAVRVQKYLNTNWHSLIRT